jgi:predicted RNA-binding Zn-ribbon protein involved in translation (DUF1610 family)
VRRRSAASGRGRWVARARSLSEFQTSFPDEASCAAFLFQRRWPQGFVCPACGSGRAALLKSRAHTYECLDCGRQTSVMAGTAMHRSKLPLTVWFWAAHLMATHSNGMSAVQLEASSYRLRFFRICANRWAERLVAANVSAVSRLPARLALPQCCDRSLPNSIATNWPDMSVSGCSSVLNFLYFFPYLSPYGFCGNVIS